VPNKCEQAIKIFYGNEAQEIPECAGGQRDSQCTMIFVFVIKCAGKIFDPSLQISFQFMVEMGFFKQFGIWESVVYVTKNLICFYS
jgi:hypothetical protein